ncbi:hypothetical protein [Streptomyces sp. NPDC002564]|uniref:hypothetical protein n=1 Tax=Streptomyces sp. NPDC002564 TaxID=3364649 RepID=UPI00369F4E05
MRVRTVAASAALVLCAATAAVACSSPDAADSKRPAGPSGSARPGPAEAEAPKGRVETGEREEHGPETGGPDTSKQAGKQAEKCEKSAAEIPEECALDLPYSDITVGKARPGSEAPATP